jgi:hypothetical protein
MISNQTLARNPQKEEENSHCSHAIIQNLDQIRGIQCLHAKISWNLDEGISHEVVHFHQQFQEETKF